MGYNPKPGKKQWFPNRKNHQYVSTETTLLTAGTSTEQTGTT